MPLLKLYVGAVFQQLEVDYIIGRPNKDVHVTDLTEVPIIRMYGVTESGTKARCDNVHRLCSLQLQHTVYLQVIIDAVQPIRESVTAGNSVCAFVHGFEPYFFVEAPPAFGPDDCDSLRAQLNVSQLASLPARVSLTSWRLNQFLNRGV